MFVIIRCMHTFFVFFFYVNGLVERNAIMHHVNKGLRTFVSSLKRRIYSFY